MTKTLIFAAAMALPFAAQAQDIDLAGMQASLSMLELNADRILDANGFDNVDPQSLDLSQIVQIIGIMNDDGGSPRSALEVVLNR